MQIPSAYPKRFTSSKTQSTNNSTTKKTHKRIETVAPTTIEYSWEQRGAQSRYDEVLVVVVDVVVALLEDIYLVCSLKADNTVGGKRSKWC